MNNYAPRTVSVAPGKTETIQLAGKFARIISVSPEVNQVFIQTEKGDKIPLLPGQGIEVDFRVIRVSHANAILTLAVTILISDAPIHDIGTVQPGSTLFTSDWVTLAVSTAVKLLGNFTIQGTNYRRKNVEIVNMTGGAGMNAAVLGIVTSAFSAKTAMTFFGGGAAWTGQQRRLMPMTADESFPMFIETDDTVNVTTYQLTGPLDLSVVQTWLPIIS